MSRIQRFRPTGAMVAAGAVLGAVALAGCSAGQITQTNTQVPAVVGANGGVGTVVVRDAHIEFGEQIQGANVYPRGGAAPLKMSIVNTGGQPDRLVSASSPAASSVTISGDADVPPGRVLLIEGEPAAAPAATQPAAPSGAPRPSPGATPPSPSAEPAAPGDEIGGAGVEAGQRPTVAAPAPPVGEAPLAGQREAQMVLTGLTEDVRAGLTYPLVLNFERAGQVTLDVPVGYRSEPREDEPHE